jgi:hypothetical protein
MRNSIDKQFDSVRKFVSIMALVAGLFGLALLASPAWSHPPTNGNTHAAPIPSTVPPDDVCRKTTPPGPCDTDHSRPKHGSLGNIGAKLADPSSNIWAMAMSFNAPAFYDGNFNSGDSKVGGAVAFEPIMPIPLYGEKEDQWKLITRPVLPIIFNQPIPKANGTYRDIGGFGDLQLTTALTPPASLMKKIAPPVGGWIFGLGPQWYIPTATNQDLGKQQFGMGPVMVAGYKNKHLTAVTLTSYTWGVANRSDKNSEVENLNQMSLLYALIFNLPGAWQIGMNPSISYNNKAGRGDKWSVPVEIFGAKTIKVGRLPVNIRLGLEYSVVSPDSFGQRAQIRLQIQPVIPGLIQNPIFGGK